MPIPKKNKFWSKPQTTLQQFSVDFLFVLILLLLIMQSTFNLHVVEIYTHSEKEHFQ